MAERIPLFPLGTVLFPGLVLPLRIFEDRYRQLLADLLDRPEGEQVFGVVAIREGREVGADGVRSLHEVGCTARLRLVEPAADGTLSVVTTGARRFRLLSLDASAAPYPTAHVELLPEPLGDCPPALADDVARLFLQYRAELLGVDAAVELPADPGQLAYAVAGALLTGIADRQGLLAAPDAGTRLRAEQALMLSLIHI
jgi:Lon protease-like protein